MTQLPAHLPLANCMTPGPWRDSRKQGSCCTLLVRGGHFFPSRGVIEQGGLGSAGLAFSGQVTASACQQWKCEPPYIPLCFPDPISSSHRSPCSRLSGARSLPSIHIPVHLHVYVCLSSWGRKAGCVTEELSSGLSQGRYKDKS